MFDVFSIAVCRGGLCGEYLCVLLSKKCSMRACSSLLMLQTAENLEYCKEYNGKLISTRGDAKLLDKNAKMVADFLANNPAASEACKVCCWPPTSLNRASPELLLVASVRPLPG